MNKPGLETWKAAITAAFPELAHSAFTLLTAGWDCVAVDVDDRLIFKFPRQPYAEEALRREASMLTVICPAVSLPVPDLQIHSGPPVFSFHQKIPGHHLLASQYEVLNDEDRQDLADQLAGFYAELHGLDRHVMAQAGAIPVSPWLPGEQILQKIQPLLDPDLYPSAERVVRAWEDLAPDPSGDIFGFFDGHGWNLAFNHATRRLQGVYDFADSGLGPLHRDFVYSQWISRDLTSRLITQYERLTQRAIDRERVDLLSGALRLSELAEYAEDPMYLPVMLRTAEDWLIQDQATDRARD